MYKILYVSGTDYIGGGEISLINLVKNIDKKLFLPIVVVPGNGSLVERLKSINSNIVIKKIKVIEFSRRKLLQFLFSVIKLALFVKKEKINLIHANSIYVAEASYFASRLTTAKCVCHIRDLVPVLGGSSPRLYAFRNMDMLVAISDAVKNDLITKLKIPKDKIIRIYNGVDIDEFQPGISGENFRRQFNLGSEELVGMIARLSPEKGHEVFLYAAREILQKYPDARFIIVGGAELGSRYLQETLFDLIRELGISNKVIFTGFIKDIPQVIAGLDIIVVPSIAEPFGRTAIEAMAMEKPVVAFNAGGIPEVISDKCAILVKQGGAGELAGAVGSLLGNKIIREEMGRCGRKIALERFSIHKNISETEVLYTKILT